jgi:hypothetical protein
MAKPTIVRGRDARPDSSESGLSYSQGPLRIHAPERWEVHTRGRVPLDVSPLHRRAEDCGQDVVGVIHGLRRLP